MSVCSPFHKMPAAEKSLLRESIMESAHKPHPSRDEMVAGLMEEHVARMQLARARQSALEAEQQASRARLAATMEAKACDELRDQLDRERAEVSRLQAERREFVGRLEAMQREKDAGAERSLSLGEMLAELRGQLEQSRLVVAECERQKAEDEQRVQAVLIELDSLHWRLKQKEEEARIDRQLAEKEKDRLVQLGLQAQKDHEAIVACKQREAKEMMASLEQKVGEIEDSNSQLRQVAKEAEAVIQDLKQALSSQVNETHAAQLQAKQLEAELESVRKSIWLRKYDPQSPRSATRSASGSPRMSPLVQPLPGPAGTNI